MQANKSLNIFRKMMICGWDKFAREKSLNVSMIKMICDSDNFAGQKFLNIFRIMMICVEDNFASKKVFEYFQHNDGFRIKQFCRRISLWMFSGKCWFAAQTILKAKKSSNIFRIMMICGGDKFAGEEVFEYFQDNDDLDLRQFCRRKSLWIISGYWWFSSRKILQAKKFLNIFRIMMICGENSFAGEKVFE